MGSVTEGEYRTQRYRDALGNVNRDPGPGTLEIWNMVLDGLATFEEYQEALHDALELRRVAREQLNSLDYLKQSNN